jgi:translation elongation factor EF-G
LNEELHHFKFIRNPSEESEIELLSDSYGDERIFSIQSLPFSLLHELETQISSALSRGALMSFPVIGIRALITGGAYTLHRTTDLAIGRCVQNLVQNLLT